MSINTPGQANLLGSTVQCNLTPVRGNTSILNLVGVQKTHRLCMYIYICNDLYLENRLRAVIFPMALHCFLGKVFTADVILNNVDND